MTMIAGSAEPEDDLTLRLKRNMQLRDMKDKAAGVLGSGSDVSPATAAKRVGLSKKTGVPTALIDSSEAERELEVASLRKHANKLAGSSTINWISTDPINASLTEDDYDPLLRVEDHLKSLDALRVDAENERNGRSGFFGVTSGLLSSLGYGATSLAAMPGDVLRTVLSATFGGKRATSAMELFYAMQPAARGAKIAQEWFGSKRRATVNALVQDPKTGEQHVNWGAVNPFSAKGLENVANMAAGEAVPLLAQYLLASATAAPTGGASLAATTTVNAGKVAKVGAFAKAVWRYAKTPAAAVNTGRVIQGQAEEGVRDLMAKGMTEDQAWEAVGPGALLAGLFSSAAGSPMEAKILEDAFTRVARQKAYAGFVARAKQRIGAAIAQGTKEGMQEVMEGLGEDLAATITYQPNKTAKEWAANAMMNFAGGSVVGGGLGASVQGSRAIHSAEKAAFIEALHDEKTRTKFLQHAPGKFGEFVAHLTKGGDVEQLLVDAQSFSNHFGEGAREKAIALGVKPEEFDISIKNGGDLVINTGVYADQIAGTDDFESVYQFTRLYQGGPTIAEQNKVFNDTKLLEEIKNLPHTDSERDNIRDEIAHQLKMASRILSDEDALAVADNYARVVSVLAKRAKMSATKLYEKEKVRIIRDYHDKMKAQKGDDHAFEDGGSDRTAEDPAVQGALPGREQASLREAEGGARPEAREGGPEGQGRGSRIRRVGRGVKPPAMTWHGTPVHDIPALAVDAGSGARAGGMSRGLHLTAGPHVMTHYAEGNDTDGMWRVGVSSRFNPFDASLEKTYTAEDLQDLGLQADREMNGSELWAYLVAANGHDAVVEHLTELGFDGLYYDHGGEDAWVVWKQEMVHASRLTTLEEAEADYARQGSRRDPVTGQLKVAQMRQALPARVPTSKKAGEIDLDAALITDLAAMLEAPDTLSTVLDTVSKWPGVRLGKGSDKTRAERFINHVTSNLLFLFDKMPESTRNRAKLWYDGANQQANELAEEHSKTLAQVAGIIAALSPQQEWFSNIELARQTLEILSTKQDTLWSKAMESASRNIDSIAKEKEVLARIRGKKLSELANSYEKAVWLRTYAEAHGSKIFYVLSPEGERMGEVTTKSGDPKKLGWMAGFKTLAKIVDVFERGTAQDIHAAIGLANKVRNFYNNIFDPTDPNFITVDTHAAGAGTLLPLGASDPEANYNFSGNSSNDVGVIGSYGLFFEAYKRAAMARGVMPREMQSITWEAVRGLFEDTQKMGSEKRRGVTRSPLYWEVSDVWKRYEKGDIGLEEAQQSIVALAGGIKPPSWSGAPQHVRYMQSSPAAAMQAQLTIESMPGGSVRESIFPGIHSATRAQLHNYHAEKMDIVLSVLREAGFDVRSTKKGHGYWGSETHPVTAFVINLDPGTAHGREEMMRAAMVAGEVINDQDGVGWNGAPEHTDDTTQHNAVRLKAETDVTREEVLALGAALDASGLPVFLDASDPADLRIVAFDFVPSAESSAQLHTKLEEVIGSVFGADKAVDLETYKAESGLVERGQHGGAETWSGAEGRSDVQGRAEARGRAEVERLNERYRSEHGWGVAPGSVRRGGELPVIRVRRGGEHARTFYGVHYSGRGGLTALDPTAYGTGARGAERTRLAGLKPGDPLLRRVYAYYSPDGSLPTPEGVVRGRNSYDALFTNVYDLTLDQHGLLAEGLDANELERRIYRLGYDGYFSPRPGQHGSIVLIGTSDIDVRPYGTPDLDGQDAGVVRYEQSAYHGSPFNFEKFTLDHIGKGEGAQAYGWGLYFAGDQSVARWYHEQLATMHRAHNTIDGKKITPKVLEKLKSDADPHVRDFFTRMVGKVATGTRDIRRYISSAISDAEENLSLNRGWLESVKQPNVVASSYKPEHYERMITYYAGRANSLRNLLGRLGHEDSKRGGQLYKVEIPNDENLLHQNRDFKDQPQQVKDALHKLMADRNIADEVAARILKEDSLGRTIYWGVSLLLGGPKEASLALNAVGIKGMSYPDGNSRTTGYGQERETKFNYVIFDAEAVEVTERYYDVVTRYAQTAYHGSRKKFDKFLLSRYGTGEGSGAHGWGLYFASHKGVAEYYRSILAQEGGGQLYKVEIPNNDELLDFDGEFKNQPGAVKMALISAFSSGDISEEAARGIGYKNKNDLLSHMQRQSTTGRQHYDTLSRVLAYGKSSRYSGDRAASLALKARGISGAYFADNVGAGYDVGGERIPTGSDFLIFDEESVQILETYYGSDADEALGYLEFSPKRDGSPRTFNLALLDGENVSTVFHELGHLYLEMLWDLSLDPQAEQSVRDDMEATLTWMGLTYAQWEGLSENDRRPYHEKFADAHLVYLREGKAPVEELRAPFRRFSSWLAKLSRKLRAEGRSMLGVKVDMTPEIRGVFDRLYASDDEIEAAKGDVLMGMFSTAEQAGMSESEFAVYAKAVANEVERAKDELLKRLMAEMQREQKKEYRDKLDELTEAVTNEVNEQPEYAALMALANGVLPDGETSVKLNRALLIEKYGKDALKLIPRDGGSVVYGPDGMDADAAAVLLGFDSGEDLMSSLIGLEPRRSRIERIAKERMQAEYPSLLMDDGALREAAHEALNGEKREAMLATELRVLRNKQRRGATERAAEKVRSAEERAADDAAMREAMDTMPKIKGLRLAASAFISNTKASELRPQVYLNAQRKAAREALAAMAKRDYASAAQAKERELLNHFLFTEAINAKQEVEAFRSWVKRNDRSSVREKMGKARGGYLAQFDALRDRFSIQRVPNKKLPQRDTLERFVQDQEGDAKDTRIAAWLLNESEVYNYRELTVAQLRDLGNALKNIKHLAYLELGTVIEGKRVEYAAMMEDFEQAFADNLPGATPLQRSTAFSRNAAKHKASNFLQGLDATLAKVQMLVNWIDGGNVDGPAHRYIWRRIAKAQHDDHKLTKELQKVLIDALEAVPTEVRSRMDTDTIKMTGWVGDQPTRTEVITMLLYCGQTERYKKLLDGYARFGMTESNLAEAFSQLTLEELNLVKNIWATFDNIRQPILDLEERLSGVRPEWEDNRSFTIHDANGVPVMDMPGGYFPLVADPVLVGELSKKQEGGTVQQIMSSNGYSRATTSTGHTKALTGKTYPLLLNFKRTLTAELANQIKDLTHRETVLSINKILSNDRFQELVKSHLGEGFEAQFMPWLTNIASDRMAGATAGMSSVDSAMLRARANVVAAVLGFKYSTIVVQLSDFVRVMAPGDYRVSPRYLASAMHKLMLDNSATVEMIKQLSPEMAQRADNLDRDLRARIDQLTGDETVLGKWQRMGFASLGAMDAIVSWPTWLGSYQQSMAEHGDSERAAREADRTVGMRLQNGAPKDLPTLLANKHWSYRAITMFMGDATANYNALRNAGHNINGFKGVPTFTGALLVVMLGQMLGDLLKGQWPDDDDWDSWALRKAVLAPMTVAPVVRDIGSAFDSYFAGKPFTDYRFSPFLSAIQKVFIDPVIHTARFIEKKESSSDYLINLAESGGYALGVAGTSQLKGTLRYLKRYAEGKERPKDPLEFAQGVLTGGNKEKKR